MYGQMTDNSLACAQVS